MSISGERFKSFEEFWPFYLSQHQNPTCRRLHLVGTSTALLFVGLGIWKNPYLILAGFLIGYAFAWVGHFAFEKNRPATFQYPIWSFLADFKMLGLFLMGRLKN